MGLSPRKGICTPFVSTTAQGVGGPAASPGADPSAPVDDCLHRWAYSLARSSDPADVVGRATVAACSAALTRWNQQGLGQPGAETAGEPLSLVDGQPTNPFAAHHEFAQDRALFYVVQARAGLLPLAAQQLVVLARAIVRNPKILILDEVTAALDFADRESVFSLMRGLAGEGCLILFITHRMDEVMSLSDRISILRGGRVVRTEERGASTPAELLKAMAPRTAAELAHGS